MIVLIPLRDLTLFTGENPDTLSEDEVVARIRADHPALFAGARIAVAEGMVSIEFPEAPSTNKAEAARLLEKGVQRSRQGEYRKAAGILERVLELDPANGPACRNLGMVLMELGETEKARQYLVESALHDPKDPWPYVVLGNALVREPGKLEAAERLLRKAHELAPDDPWAINSLGGIATERGDLAGATDWFQKSLAVKPDFANAHYGLANALATQGRFDEARARLHLLFRTAKMHDQHIAAPQTFSALFKRDDDPDLPEGAPRRLLLDGRIKQEEVGRWWFRTVTGTIPDGRKTLVIWRKRPGGETAEGIEQDNLVLDEWFTRQGYSSKDSEFDLIYVNGDNNLENLKAPDDTWKVRLIEEDFHRLMFDTEGA